MIKELEIKLAEIKSEIAQLDADQDIEAAYYLGRKWSLQSMQVWIEGMIANYCE